MVIYMHSLQALNEIARRPRIDDAVDKKTNSQAAALLHEAPKGEMISNMSETSQSNCGASPDGKSCLTTTGQATFLYQPWVSDSDKGVEFVADPNEPLANVPEAGLRGSEAERDGLERSCSSLSAAESGFSGCKCSGFVTVPRVWC